MRNQLQEYFYYTRMERNGLLVLIGICLFCFALPFMWVLFLPNPTVDFSAFQSEIAAFQPTYDDGKTKNKSLYASSMGTKETVMPVKMFHFDPNTATKEDLNKLGLSNKTAYNIINYREKVHPFAKVEDLKAIYTLKETDYKRLESYVRIASLPKQALKHEAHKTEKKNYKIATV